MTFTDLFVKATGFNPYPYQQRLAEGGSLPALLKVPTGTGKTEAAVLGWLYRHFEHPSQQVRYHTPRRLVYCLPMRTLVEQTAARVRFWLDKLDRVEDIGTVKLLGGAPRTQWYLHPEKPAIIIGTQDMLLSRALNRGYGSSPFMWPVEFALLNNDCLWVMDEVQLMANGLSTSAQLAGLRCKLGSFGPAHSLWMSATMQPEWLDTKDHPITAHAPVVELNAADMEHPALAKRCQAQKIVTEVVFPKGKKYPKAVAAGIVERHQRGTLTLMIANTVGRAQTVFQALQALSTEIPAVLVHSRFREADRQAKQSAISKPPEPTSPGLIVIATQAVEAGVDISARTLITELAPWPSLIQRFGRCNRKGEYEKGEVHWIDVGTKKNDAAPYAPEEVETARMQLKSREGQSVGPMDLGSTDYAPSASDCPAVIRQRDIVGLFDAAPDLSGNYLDVSSYVRGAKDRDVLVFWRLLAGREEPDHDLSQPGHAETVSVPLGSNGIKKYQEEDSKRKIWVWDFLDRQWRLAQSKDLHPGAVLLLDASQGGYSPELGWDPSCLASVAPERDTERDPAEGMSSDLSSCQARFVTLAIHTGHVEVEMQNILNALPSAFMEQEFIRVLKTAVLYHDIGKAHPVFQTMLRQGLPAGVASLDRDVILAKSPGRGSSERRHFRHELGSALAVLQHAKDLEPRCQDLAAYIVAAHHGKVRLSIRALPGQKRKFLDTNPERDYLLGYSITDVETLPPMRMQDGVQINETVLNMAIARIGLDDAGQQSWLDRSLALLDWLGPFKLAYLEAHLRVADMRASKNEAEGVN